MATGELLRDLPHTEDSRRLILEWLDRIESERTVEQTGETDKNTPGEELIENELTASQGGPARNENRSTATRGGPPSGKEGSTAIRGGPPKNQDKGII